jgi:predicted transcriptional regulator
MTNKSIRDYINLIENAQREGVAEGLADTQQKIVDTINKLEDRLKHAKTPEQWDNIKDRIERLQAGLSRSKQGVAEEQLEETTPDAMSKIDELFRDK